MAFTVYLNLLKRIGPERSAYVFVLVPIIALGLSTIFEDFHWTANTLIGIAFVLWGNFLVLVRKQTPISTAVEEIEVIEISEDLANPEGVPPTE